MGVAVRGHLCLDLDLPDVVWKPIVKLQTGAHDLEAVDTLCVQILQKVRGTKHDRPPRWLRSI